MTDAFIDWLVKGVIAIAFTVLGWLFKREIASYDRRIKALEDCSLSCASREEVESISKRVNGCATHDDIENLRRKELQRLDDEIQALAQSFSQVVKDEISGMRKEQEDRAKRQDERLDKIYELLATKLK